jgi:PAS domain-containing protein
MKSSVEQKIITTLLGLALLMVWSTATQTNSTSLLVFFGSSFGVLIFLLMYNFLSHQLRKHQLLDSTERKQAEAKLQESERKFRQLAENINEVFG